MGTISKSGITPSQIIKSEHILRIINALDGTVANDVTISGSLKVSSSIILNGTSLTPSPISVTGTTLFSNNPATSNTNGIGSINLGVFSGYFATNANNSNFLGQNAGYLATRAANSNFLGQYAGDSAVSASDSNFLGEYAGANATTASNSNFFGQQAGRGATNANTSNFLGYLSGYNATNAYSSNFLGVNTGEGASGAQFSNFLGAGAGNNATNAQFSNFIGYQAGLGATNASYSTVIGGYNAGSVGIGQNNIIIGNGITLPNNTRDSINIGGVIFATGSYFNLSTSNFSGSAANPKVGIGTATPAYTLDVSGSTRLNDILILTPRTTTPTPVEGMIIASGSTGASILYYYNGTTWNALF